MPMKTPVVRGDIVEVDLKGALGAEKANDKNSGGRPCVVVQNDIANGVSQLTIIVPLNDARQYKKLPFQVLVEAGDLLIAGSKQSVIECGHVRSIDGDGRVRSHLGKVGPGVMGRVAQGLAEIMGMRLHMPKPV